MEMKRIWGMFALLAYQGSKPYKRKEEGQTNTMAHVMHRCLVAWQDAHYRQIKNNKSGLQSQG